jgi:hypothetical protein
MPALVTYGRKKAFLTFVTRLKASGKTPITIAQAVLKSQTRFNPVLHAN